jgi:hypothetical protein
MKFSRKFLKARDFCATFFKKVAKGKQKICDITWSLWFFSLLLVAKVTILRQAQDAGSPACLRQGFGKAEVRAAPI